MKRRTPPRSSASFAVLALLMVAGCRTAPWQSPLASGWTSVHALLTPPPSPLVPTDATDPSSLDGKIMAGYQGWFVAKGDGTGLDWTHYGTGPRNARHFEPGAATIDLWPDLTEAGKSERYPTAFRAADGSPAEVFTSRNPATIDRHFRWMHDYGIDGVFLQRFASELQNPALAALRNEVLRGVRTSAARHGRTWAIMYDLSGMRAGTVERAIEEDWKRLVDLGNVRRDPRLQHFRGRPLVALWGVGFNDGRRYSLDECERLVRWLRDDRVYGGNAVLLGVPYAWRTLDRDAASDPALLRVCSLAAIVSPWSVGRIRSPGEAVQSREKIAADLLWSRDHGVDYLPVIYPGFSWHNLMQARGQTAEPNAIPRLGGVFFSAQADTAIAAGARMLYVAMFDELDEGTAIMKTSDHPPAGASPFVSEPGVPPDRYLQLAGDIRAQLQAAIAATPRQP